MFIGGMFDNTIQYGTVNTVSIAVRYHTIRCTDALPFLWLWRHDTSTNCYLLTYFITYFCNIKYVYYISCTYCCILSRLQR